MKEAAGFTLTQEIEMRVEYESFHSAKADEYVIPNEKELAKPVYIISKRWLLQWEKYMEVVKPSTRGQSKKAKVRVFPGSINNEDILENELDYYRTSNPDDLYNVVLKPGMQKNEDFEIITEEQWNVLHAKYSGIPIKRKTYLEIHKSPMSTFPTIEVDLQQVNLILLPDWNSFDKKEIKPSKPMFYSKYWTLGAIKERIAQIIKDNYNLQPKEFRMWRIDSLNALGNSLNKIAINKDQDYSVVECPGICISTFSDSTLIKELEFTKKDHIAIELPNPKGEFIFKYRNTIMKGECGFCDRFKPLLIVHNEVYYCSMACKERYESLTKKVMPFEQNKQPKLGITGLFNFGTTCFMNSGVQCLSNTWLLAKYFLEDRYLSEISTGEPKGQMTEAFANLLKGLWYGSDEYIIPLKFKKIIESKQKTFNEPVQHDSQELISAVLDSLHEELNRVKVKPSIKQRTIEDVDDDSAKDPSWNDYLMFNMSIIIDLFAGQYKSILQCTQCQKCSINFMPFTMISLPIPEIKEKMIKIIYVPYDIKKPLIKTAFALDKDATLDDLRTKLSQLLGVDKYGSVFASILGAESRSIIKCNYTMEGIQRILRSDAYLFAYEINLEYLNCRMRTPKGENSLEEDKLPRIDEVKEVKDNKRKEKKTKSQILHIENGIKMLAENVIMIPIRIKKLLFKGPAYTSIVRMLFINKFETLRDLHFEVYHLIKPLITKRLSEMYRRELSRFEQGELMSDEESYEESFNIKSISNNKLYSLNFVSQRKQRHSPTCIFCGEFCYNECPVPFMDIITVNDMILLVKRARSEENHNIFNGPFRTWDTFELEVIFNRSFKIRQNDIEEDVMTKIDNMEIERNLNIYDCLNNFNAWENLDDDNLWHCPHCNQDIKARKKLEITRAPPILILHIMRYKSGLSMNRMWYGSKTSHNIEFPLKNLDLTPYIKTSTEKPIYDLYAVSNHKGMLAFGHYTAFVLNKNEWYLFDDINVTKTNESNICTDKAYILFYKRQDITDDIDYERIRQTAVVPHEISQTIAETSKEQNNQ